MFIYILENDICNESRGKSGNKMRKEGNKLFPGCYSIG